MWNQVSGGVPAVSRGGLKTSLRTVVMLPVSERVTGSRPNRDSSRLPLAFNAMRAVWVWPAATVNEP